MTNKFMRKIRELSDEELDSLESALRTELSLVRMPMKVGGYMRNTAGIGNLRRNIARILTLKRERRETD